VRRRSRLKPVVPSWRVGLLLMTDVRLEPQEWNQLLQILAQAPWNVANPLIMKIGEQLRARQQGELLQGQQHPPGNSDGRDKVEH
jgi:hypothetical protein